MGTVVFGVDDRVRQAAIRMIVSIPTGGWPIAPTSYAILWTAITTGALKRVREAP